MPSKPIQIAGAVNGKLEQFMPLLFPFGIALGFTMPGAFGQLRPFVPWLFGMMTLSGALRLTVAEFGKTIRNPLPIFFFMIAVRVLMPLIALFASSLFFGGNPDIITGFVLLFSGPVGVASFIWVGMYKGDKALCLTLILLDTLLAPLVVPATLSILIGERVALDISGIAMSLVLMVVLPTIIGVTMNETSKGKIPKHVCPFLTPFAKIFLMLVIAANSSAIAPTVRFSDPLVWKVAALSTFLSIGSFLLSKFIGIASKCGFEKTVAMFFTGGLKNISAVATIAVTFFPEAVALPAITGIVFQQTIAAVMGKLMRKENKAPDETQTSSNGDAA